MKPHHRTSLLLGCLGLFFLYLPDGLRVVGDWPSPPGVTLLGQPEPGLVSGAAAVPVPTIWAQPEGPAPVLDGDPGARRDEALYAGGQ
jgi:hypothetical protein